MKVLRTVSTRRLLAGVAGLLLVAGSGTAIAVAASGSGPVPASKPLAQAIHDGLSAPVPSGITAEITFTNHLIDASALPGSDPLLKGATGRLWLSGDHLRLELQSDKGDAQILVNGSSFFISDPAMKTVYEGTLPAQTGKPTEKHGPLPTLARIQSALNDLMRHANVSGAQPSNVAGHGTYTVKVSPAHDGGLLGAAKMAWDASTGVPLRFAVYSSTSGTPVLEVKATAIAYGAVPASVFNISPPSDAKVVKVSTGSDTFGGKSETAKKHSQAITGVSAVAAKLPFKLNAPSQLVGLPRRSVTVLSWGHEPAALITYGQNLGGIAVIEQLPLAKSAGTSTNTEARDGGSGLNLPTVSINGATGQELDTALGTMVRFTRAGVAYTVVGSVPAAAADAAARGL